MSYRPTTHPTRVTVTLPLALSKRIDGGAGADHDRSAVIRAAIFAAGDLGADVPRPEPRMADTVRHALRLCGASRARVLQEVDSGRTFAGALRALVADGLTRDWRAQLRRAEMGDAWRDDGQ